MARLSEASSAALERLRAYVPPKTVFSSLPMSRRAAVLLLLFADRHGELKVVLTMRADTLKTYPGQVALPGGKAEDEAELPFDVARREAFEEIGLPMESAKLPYPFRVEHLCELPTFMARTEIAVRPCVAFLHSGSLNAEESLIPTLDAKEVAAVFSAEFPMFLVDRFSTERSEAPGHESSHIWYSGTWGNWNGQPWRMHSFNVPLAGQAVIRPKTSRNEATSNSNPGTQEESTPDTYCVFGMTAKILVDAARVAYGTNPSFEYNTELGDETIVEKLQQSGRLKTKRKAESNPSSPNRGKAAKI